MRAVVAVSFALALAFCHRVVAGVFDPTGSVSELDYWPPLTSPTASDVWSAGETYTVSWDDSLPAGVNSSEVGQTASVYLGYTDLFSEGEHLDTVLASDVPLYTSGGFTNVTLPLDLSFRSTYIVALIGSSSDTSPKFTILPSLSGISAAKEKRGRPSEKKMKRERLIQAN